MQEFGLDNIWKEPGNNAACTIGHMRWIEASVVNNGDDNLKAYIGCVVVNLIIQ